MTSYPDTLQRGDMISCYKIEDVLGRGGFAVTYLAVDLNLDVHVAIKEYLPREIIQRDDKLNVSARRPEFVEDYNIGLNNFAREAKTLARFKHLNIVRVHQVIHKYNTAYMVMDYEHGQEFADVLDKHKTIPEEDLREILFPIFDGVQEIHNAGLAHRDIKPSNIYLRDNGSPVLLDFGAARYTMSETTQQLTAVVTVGYTPIEQYNVSDNDQGPWSDIYALAAVLYEAVTGEMPVDSVTRASSTLTKQEDPLASVSNKVQQHYSEDFMKAIDWGLRMEAEARPQSIAQWRAAFNGDYRPASDFEQKKPPGRPSRLKTRERYQSPFSSPPEQASQNRSEQSRTEENTASDLDVEVRANRFDTQHDDDIDDVEIIPLNTTEDISHEDGERAFRDHNDSYHPDHYTNKSAGGKTNNTADIRSRTQQPQSQPDNQDQTRKHNAPASPFANNPAMADQNNTQAANRNTIEPESTRPATPQSAANTPPAPTQTLNDTLNNISNNHGQTTHTQELRNVLRRDIVKRAPTPPNTTPPTDSDGYISPYQATIKDNDQSRGQYDNHRTTAPADDTPQQDLHGNNPPHAGRDSIRRPAPIRNEIQFDETDWDYEHPTPPSKWRWLLPATGLLAVVGGSLLFVNNPGLFKLPGKDAPELTVTAALDKAQQQMSEEAFIFPTGQSAFDYYQLILATEPDNPLALDGIATIKSTVKDQIIDNIDANDLNEANRLLSQATDRGLQIEGLPGSPESSKSSEAGASGFAADQTPWVDQKVADIEQLIREQRFDEAEVLFIETDKYLADAKLSSALRNQIEDGKSGIYNSTTQDQDPVTVETDTQTNFSIEPSTGEGLPTDSSPTTEALQAQQSATENTNAAAGTIPEATNVPASPSSLPVPANENNLQSATTPQTPASIAIPLGSDITPTVSLDQNLATVTEPETLPSAPRRSFIEGNDATARHLNQLRVAIEAKDLGDVLNISNSLPAERTEFLRKMFQRYDRLDVTIDDINRSANSATARLSVSMFNQRSDGSYYSAGKWNGVTLSTDQQSGVWQKIRW